MLELNLQINNLKRKIKAENNLYIFCITVVKLSHNLLSFPFGFDHINTVYYVLNPFREALGVLLNVIKKKVNASFE